METLKNEELFEIEGGDWWGTFGGAAFGLLMCLPF
jgi:hypothetical protein